MFNNGAQAQPPRTRRNSVPDGVYVIVKNPNNNPAALTFNVPRSLAPGQAIQFIYQRQEFQEAHPLLGLPETDVVMMVYQGGQRTKAFPLKKAQHVVGAVPHDGGEYDGNAVLRAAMTQNQNGQPMPEMAMPPLPQQQGPMPQPEYEPEQGQDEYQYPPQVSAGQILRARIDKLERELYNLQNLIPIVDSLQVESLEELALRSLLLAGK